LHAASLARAQQVRPGLAGLAEPVSERDEFLGPVRADAEDDEQAYLVLLESDLQVDPVDPHVDVVGVLERAGVEGPLLLLPLRGQPGDRRGRQARTGAQELLQRRPEVAAGQPVQVHQRQHLRDLRRLARPGRQDRRAEPDPLASRVIDALVVDPRRSDGHRPRRGHHFPLRVRAVSHHQPPPVGIEQIGVRIDVGSDLDLQCRGEHLSSTLTDQSVEQRPTRGRGLVTGLAVLLDYFRASWTSDHPREGAPVHVTSPRPIHRF